MVSDLVYWLAGTGPGLWVLGNQSCTVGRENVQSVSVLSLICCLPHHRNAFKVKTGGIALLLWLFFSRSSWILYRKHVYGLLCILFSTDELHMCYPSICGTGSLPLAQVCVLCVESGILRAPVFMIMKAMKCDDVGSLGLLELHNRYVFLSWWCLRKSLPHWKQIVHL